MAKLLLNADGKVLTSNDKVLKAPEGVNVMKTLLDGRKEAKYLFEYYDGESVDDLISYSDTENVTTTQSMFSQCKKLNTIPNLDTKNATDMNYMYEHCQMLKTISYLDTSNATNIGGMFNGCGELENIPQLNTNNVTNMMNTFSSCKLLKTIDITSLDKISSTRGTQWIFNACFSLTKVIIRTMTVIPPLHNEAFRYAHHYLGTVDNTYNPEGLKDGRVYVPDDKVEELKQATNWSVYADIIVPLSTLVEE